MERHHVHLSRETETTMAVGSRHGTPALLTILAAAMHREGHIFYLSTNGVWLVDHVPVKFIQFP
jgi:putative RNA 2'-phosphotransferase